MKGITVTDRELLLQWLQPGAIVPVDTKTVRILVDALRERLAQPEQEPVAWLYRDLWGTMKLSQVTPPPVGAFPVYTTPTQRKPLTDEEIGKIAGETLDPWSCARAIEAAHGIKGKA